MLSDWYGGKKTGITLVLASSGLWLCANLVASEQCWAWLIFIWNASVGPFFFPLFFIYFAFGAAEKKYSNSQSMPFIMGDILVDFDGERSEAVLIAAVQLTQKIQVILLTYHSGLVEQVRISKQRSVYVSGTLQKQAIYRLPLGVPYPKPSVRKCRGFFI